MKIIKKDFQILKQKSNLIYKKKNKEKKRKSFKKNFAFNYILKIEKES